MYNFLFAVFLHISIYILLNYLLLNTFNTFGPTDRARVYVLHFFTRV